MAENSDAADDAAAKGSSFGDAAKADVLLLLNDGDDANVFEGKSADISIETVE